jgi:hypothetical protein
MRHIVIVIATLLPFPGIAAELWCMPDTLCRPDGSCRATTDEESSIRLADLQAESSTLRADAEDIVLTRLTGGTVVEWAGTDGFGRAISLIWTVDDMGYTYSITESGGAVFKDSGVCEVQ